MKFRNAAALLFGIVAWSLAPHAAVAAPRYQVQMLPDRGRGSQSNGGGEVGGVFVAAGDVTGDDAVDVPALWARKGRKWQLHELSHLGHGGSARIISDKATPLLLVGGSVEDEAGVERAAVWVVERTRRGWSDTLVLLNPTDGARSEASAFVGGATDRVLVIGSREQTAGSGVFHPIVWELFPDGAVEETILPGLGGLSAEATAGGVVLPGGELRILGCAQLPGSSLEFACEWRGDPQGVLIALLLPAVAPGLEEYHVIGVDPLFRYAVGAQFFAGGAFAPAGWATFPSSVGEWTPLEVPGVPNTVGHLRSVNSSGRAVGMWDDLNLAFTQRVHVPQSEARPLLVKALCENEVFAAPVSGSRSGPAAAAKFTDLLVTSITERGFITGAGVGGGPHRAVVGITSSVDVVDYLSVSEGQPIPELGTPEESDLFYIDDIIIGIRAPSVDEWLGVKINIDIAHTVLSDLTLTVTSRLDAPRRDSARQVLCLWSFTQAKYIELDPMIVRGGKFQTLKHRLPEDLAQFISPHGDLHMSLRWNGAGFPHTGTGYAVLINSVTLSNQ